MARPKLRQLQAEFVARYPWYEQHRCCDQKYDLHEDSWTAEELAELKTRLHNRDVPFIWEIPLRFHYKEVGSISIDSRKLFDAIQEIIREERAFIADGRLSDEALNRPLSDDETDRAVGHLAATLFEGFYFDHILEDAFNDAVNIAPLLNRGPQGLVDILNKTWEVEQLGSKRLLRALYAVGAANSFQKLFKANSHAQAWQARIRREEPYRLIPLGITTLGLVRKFRALLETSVEHEDPTLRYRPSGRPRKVDPGKVRDQFRSTRIQLSDFHKRLKRLHSPRARRSLLNDYPEIAARLSAANIETGVVDGDYRQLESLICAVLSREMNISPQTARRYARSSIRPKIAKE